MNIIYCMPSMTVFPRSPEKAIEYAAKAGFGAIEFLLAGAVLRDPYRYAKLADYAGLKPRFHKAWDRTSSTEKGLVWTLAWGILTLIRWLPHPEASYKERSPTIPYPVVDYANDLSTVLAPNHLIQTASEMTAGGEFITPFGPFERVCEVLRPLRVLDTYHRLEHEKGRAGLYEMKPDEALAILSTDHEKWRTLTKEIHFQDWRRGPSPEKSKRSVWPGKGSLPLREFGHGLAETGVDEIVVTPELSFTYFLTDPLPKLRRLREDTEALIFG